jgi:hypothetical protein
MAVLQSVICYDEFRMLNQKRLKLTTVVQGRAVQFVLCGVEDLVLLYRPEEVTKTGITVRERELGG